MIIDETSKGIEISSKSGKKKMKNAVKEIMIMDIDIIKWEKRRCAVDKHLGIRRCEK